MGRQSRAGWMDSNDLQTLILSGLCIEGINVLNLKSFEFYASLAE